MPLKWIKNGLNHPNQKKIQEDKEAKYFLYDKKDYLIVYFSIAITYLREDPVVLLAQFQVSRN